MFRTKAATSQTGWPTMVKGRLRRCKLRGLSSCPIFTKFKRWRRKNRRTRRCRTTSGTTAQAPKPSSSSIPHTTLATTSNPTIHPGSGKEEGIHGGVAGGKKAESARQSPVGSGIAPVPTVSKSWPWYHQTCQPTINTPPIEVNAESTAETSQRLSMGNFPIPFVLEPRIIESVIHEPPDVGQQYNPSLQTVRSGLSETLSPYGVATSGGKAMAQNRGSDSSLVEFKRNNRRERESTTQSVSPWSDVSFRFSLFSDDATLQSSPTCGDGDDDEDLKLDAAYWKKDPSSGRFYHWESDPQRSLWYPDKFD